MSVALAVLAVLAVLSVLAVWAVWAVTRRRTEGLKLLSINGEDNDEPHPYYVQLISAKTGKPSCGGVLIEKDVVLTAAHCFADDDLGLPLETMKIGKMYCTIGDDNTAEPIEYRYIRKIVIHPQYDTVGGYNCDLALLFLDKEVETKPVVKRLSDVPLLRASTFVTIGRGRTNRKIPPYLPNSRTRYQGEYLPSKTVLTLPRDLQAQIPGTVTISANKTHFEAVTTGSNPFFGDSGGPLLVKVDEVWQLVGIVSTGSSPKIIKNNNNLYLTKYSNVSYHKSWIDTAIAKEKLDKNKLTNTVSVREIEHVVALTRLKHLKKIAKMKNTTFEDLFLAGGKERWLDLGKYFESEDRYDDLIIDIDDVTEIKKDVAKEVQLAVLWALVSNRENYKVLHEMVTADTDLEGGGIPYFCRLRYHASFNQLFNSARDEKGDKDSGSMSFDMDLQYGQRHWTKNSGKPTFWSSEYTEKKVKDGLLSQKLVEIDDDGRVWEASKAELKLEKKQKNLRDMSGSKMTNKLFLEARPLRRRMFCDFMETLREYVSERRPWYSRYFQFNNIDSPARTAGLYECLSKNWMNDYDGQGDFKSSYGPAKQPCALGDVEVFSEPRRSRLTLEALRSGQNEIFDKTYAKDPLRFWLQDSGEYWPELTSTTLYDRYEWIEMPDDKRKITFREALFLIRDEERIEVPKGVWGSDAIAPTMDDGTLNKHPGSNKIPQFYPLFIVYFYTYLLKKVNPVGRTVRGYILEERLRGALKSEKETVQQYTAGELVSYIQNKGYLTSYYEDGTIMRKGRYVPKNNRIIIIETPEKTTRKKLGNLSLEDIDLFLNSGIRGGTRMYIYPEQHSSWIEYQVSQTRMAWASEIEERRKPIHARYLSTPPECKPSNVVKKVPATKGPQQKPGDRGGGGDQEKELDVLIANISTCI